LDILITKNILESYEIVNNRVVLIYLRHLKNHGYVFKKMKLISKPSKRIYFRRNNHKSMIYLKKYSLILVSTSKGIITLQEALYYGVGGEIILGIIM